MSVRPTSIYVDVDGVDVEVPALSAADWLIVLLTEPLDYFSIFPGLLSEEDYEEVNEALFDGRITIEQTHRLALDVVAMAAGRPWWVTFRLVGTLASSWQTIGAMLLRRGFRWEDMSFSGFLDVLLLEIMNAIDPKEATMFTMKLEMVPPEEVANTPEPQIAANQFLSMS